MLSARIVEQAIAEAYAKGYAGKNILGSGFDFDLYMNRVSAAGLTGYADWDKNGLTLIRDERDKREQRNKRALPYRQGDKVLPGVDVLKGDLDQILDAVAAEVRE